MKILQNKHTGEAKILFTTDEIKMINKKKGIEFDALGIKQFSNHLASIAIELSRHVPQQFQQVGSSPEEHIEPKKDAIKKISK
jgi:hypothetical protein